MRALAADAATSSCPGRSASRDRGFRAALSRTRSDWRRASTSNAKCPTSSWRSDLASSRSAASCRGHSPGTRARACSGCRRTRRSSTGSASTATASRSRPPPAARQGRPGIVGVNIGANKDSAGPDRRLRGLHGRGCAAWPIRDDQRVVAEHAGPARSPGRGISRRSAGALHRRARRRIAAGPSERPSS